MKKAITTIILSINIVICSGQFWETIPEIPFEHKDVHSITHYDGELYTVIDTVPAYSDDKFIIITYNGLNWEVFDNYGFQITPEIKNLNAYNVGDSSLLIVLDYYDDLGRKRERALIYQEGQIEVLTDHKPHNSTFNSTDHNKALVNEHGYVFFDKLNPSSSDDTMITVFSDGLIRDTLYKFNIQLPDPLRSASKNGFDFYSSLEIDPFQCNECFGYYSLITENYSQIMAQGINLEEHSIYSQGSVYTTSDPFFFSSSHPQRRLVYFFNGQPNFIGHPDMLEARGILDTPMGLIVESKMINDNVYRTYVYDGSNYSLLSTDLLLNSSGGSARTNFYYFQDHLYAYGSIDQVNYNVTAYNIVRMPYTHSVNLPPVAQDDAFLIPTDTTIQRLRMRVNDSDVDGDHLFGEVISAEHGLVQQHLSGDFIYTPEMGFQGIDTIKYKACDLGGLCDSAFIYVTIQQVVSTSPVATTDHYVMMEDESINFDVKANDDYQNESILIELLDSTVNGTIDSMFNGHVYYTPHPTFAGMDSLRYVATKSYGLSDTAWVSLEVILINSAPESVSQRVPILLESTEVSLSNLVSDVDADFLTYGVVDGPFHSDANTSTGSHNRLYYNNELWQTVGLDSIQFQVCDPYGACDSSWIVFHNNRVPLTLRDTVFVSSSNQVFFPVNNDHDPDGNLSHVEVTIQPVSVGAHAQTCGPFCIQYINSNLAAFSLDSIEYRLFDDLGLQSKSWVILINEQLTIEELNKPDVTIFPVPNEGQLYFHSESMKKADISIMDAYGKTVFEVKGFDLSLALNIEHLPAGPYRVSINNQEKPKAFVLTD